MKYKYNKELNISYSDLDNTGRLGLSNCICYVQDMITEYFESFGSDNFTLKNKNNAAWVITKTKIRFHVHPMWKEKLKAEAYCISDSAIRFETELTFGNNNQNYFEVKQEYCAIDLLSRRARKLSTICYPDDMEYTQSVYEEDYQKLKDSFSESDFITTQKIRFSDIDFSNHTNNVTYVRFIMNTFDTEFFKNSKIKDFEIHYISESKENQELKIYRKQISDKEFIFLLKENDREVVRALLRLE